MNDTDDAPQYGPWPQINARLLLIIFERSAGIMVKQYFQESSCQNLPGTRARRESMVRLRFCFTGVFCLWQVLDHFRNST
jgi:hypothetical protein